MATVTSPTTNPAASPRRAHKGRRVSAIRVWSDTGDSGLELLVVEHASEEQQIALKLASLRTALEHCRQHIDTVNQSPTSLTLSETSVRLRGVLSELNTIDKTLSNRGISYASEEQSHPITEADLPPLAKDTPPNSPSGQSQSTKMAKPSHRQVAAMRNYAQDLLVKCVEEKEEKDGTVRKRSADDAKLLSVDVNEHDSEAAQASPMDEDNPIIGEAVAAALAQVGDRTHTQAATPSTSAINGSSSVTPVAVTNVTGTVSNNGTVTIPLTTPSSSAVVTAPVASTPARGGKGAMMEQYSVSRWGEVIKESRAPPTAAELKKREANLVRDEERELKWIKMIKDWGKYDKSKPDKVKRRIRKGIPDSMRGTVWPRLTGALDAMKNAKPGTYRAKLAQDCELSDVIGRDIARTFPHHLLFRDELGSSGGDGEEAQGSSSGRQSLYNVLKAYANYDTQVGYCLSEDSRVLTNEGFLFLAEVEQRFPKLLFACYNETTQGLEYHPASRLIVKPAANHRMVEFTPASEQSSWGETSTDYDHVEKTGNNSNHVSLLVTEEHDMYVQHGKNGRDCVAWEDSPFAKVKAEALLPTAEDQNGAVRLLGYCSAGAQGGSTELPFVTALALRTASQQKAFLGLYGFWLRDGTMSYLVDGRGGYNAVQFTQNKKADVNWLIAEIKKTELKENDDWCSCYSDAYKKTVIYIINKAWFAFFDAEYGKKDADSSRYVAFSHPPAADEEQAELDEIESDDEEHELSMASTTASISAPLSSMDEDDDEPSHINVHIDEKNATDKPANFTKSVKWFAAWTFELLDHDQMRLVLEGYRRADGSWKSDQKKIYTADAMLRDDLVRAFLHAGYSSYFVCRYLSGTVCAYKWHDQVKDNKTYTVSYVHCLSDAEQSQYKPVVARSDSWIVRYVDPKNEPCAATATLNSANDIRRVDDYHGRVWCVTVPTGLIIAQRAKTNIHGAVTQASRAVVVGNCQGMGFIAGLFLMYVSEEEAFWMLERVMRGEKYNMYALYAIGFPLLHQWFYQLEQLIAKFQPKLFDHLQMHGITPTLYATQWFFTVFANNMPFELVLRIWDIFLSEGPKVPFRFSLSLLNHFAAEIVEQDFEGSVTVLKDMHNDPYVQDTDRVIEEAMALKLKSAELRSLAHEYDQQQLHNRMAARRKGK